MFVVINGGGAVGSFLARTLSGKGHAVAVVEKRPEVARRRAEELSTGSLLIEGDGCNARILEEAGVDRADVFASVTPHDDENLVSCQIAKLHFGVRRVVARVNGPRAEGIFHALGIEAISTTTIMGRLIEEEVTVGDVIRLYTLQKGRVALVETEVPRNPAFETGRRVSDLGLPDGIVLVSLIRKDTVVIPRGGTVLEPGDRVLAVTLAGREMALERSLRGDLTPENNGHRENGA